MINLKEVIAKYPECLESESKLRSYLVDLYPDEKLYAGILADMLSDGIVDEMKGKSNIDTLTFGVLCDKVENKRGLARKYVEGCLNIWANAFDIEIKTSPAPQKLTPVKRTHKKVEITDELHEHKYIKTVIPPTCKEKGYTLYSCDCGYEYKDTFVNQKHDFVLVEYVEPTCEKDGKETYKCSCCGEEKVDILSAKGHKFGKWIEQKKPTCTESGLEVRQCSKCGKKEQRNIDSKGHKWSEWRLEGDLKIRDCSDCGETETIDLAEERRKQKIIEQQKIEESRNKEFAKSMLSILFGIIVLIMGIIRVSLMIKDNSFDLGGFIFGILPLIGGGLYFIFCGIILIPRS